MTNLPPFSETSKCPKCGYAGIAVRFCKGYVGEGCVVFLQYIGKEHIDRVCRRCSYGWAEMPIDQSPVVRVGLVCPKCNCVIDDADYWNVTMGCCLRCALEKPSERTSAYIQTVDEAIRHADMIMKIHKIASHDLPLEDLEEKK